MKNPPEGEAYGLAFPIGEGGNKRNAQLTEEVKQRNFYIYAYSINSRT